MVLVLLKAFYCSVVGCKAKLVIARAEETGRWFVKDFNHEHNHPLAPNDLACLWSATLAGGARWSDCPLLATGDSELIGSIDAMLVAMTCV
jgi:hypothetical protein